MPLPSRPYEGASELKDIGSLASSTVSEMALRGRIGAYSLHAKHDTHVVSAPGRRAAENALNTRLLAEIDPEGKLSDSERERRLGHARAAHFSRLALAKATQARAKKSRARGAVGAGVT